MTDKLRIFMVAGEFNKKGGKPSKDMYTLWNQLREQKEDIEHVNIFNGGYTGALTVFPTLLKTYNMIVWIPDVVYEEDEPDLNMTEMIRREFSYKKYVITKRSGSYILEKNETVGKIKLP